MEVNKISAYIIQAGQKTEKADTRIAAEQPPPSSKEAQPAGDRVEFSKEYLEIIRSWHVTVEGNGIRMDQVASLRAMVENDTYSIVPEDVADKMLEMHV